MSKEIELTAKKGPSSYAQFDDDGDHPHPSHDVHHHDDVVVVDRSCFSYGTRPRTLASRHSLPSALTFSYLNGMVKQGRKRALDENDLPPLEPDDQADGEANILREVWRRELKRTDGKNPSLRRALCRAYGWWFFVCGAWKFPQDCLIFVTPVILQKIILFCQETNPQWGDGLLLVAVLFVAAIIQSICLHQYFHRGYRIAMGVRSGLAATVFEKSTRLSCSARASTTAGEMVNLMSNDVNKVIDVIPYLHNLLWSAAFQVFVSMVFLYRFLGVAAFAGLAVMVVVIPLNAKVMDKLKKVQETNMGHKDNRIKTIKETLSGIRIIKFFAWEDPISRRVAEFREREVRALRHFAIISSFHSVFWNSTPVIVSVFTFGLFGALGGVLSLEMVFPALSLFNIMRFPLNVVPMVYAQLVAARVSILRLEKFLLLAEREMYVENIEDNEHNHSSSGAAASSAPAKDLAIEIDNGTFEWVNDTPVLHNIRLSVNRGQMVAVIGAVGCGKSSLLSALLGEITKVKGRVSILPKVAYVSQQAWIQGASLRDNIVCGTEIDQKRYAETIRVCALEADFAILQDGDLTEIGEGGINLSGGQKQRVALARAVYADADVYLLDDPLSAVDAHVGNHIFFRCFMEYLAKKTRVLVTHRLDILPHVDRVVVIDDGVVVQQGTYLEVREKSSMIRAFVADHHDDDPSHDGLGDETPAQGENETNKAGVAPIVVADSASSSKTSTSTSSSTTTTTTTTTTGAAGVLSKSVSPRELVTAEQRATGGVTMRVVKMYMGPMGSVAVISVLLIGTLTQATRLGTDWWLSYWASSDDSYRFGFYLSIYFVWTMAQALTTAFRDIILTFSELRAATILHNKMFMAVMRAPMSFYDTTPTGRIITRFSSDQSVVDETLPRSINSLTTTFFNVIATLVAVIGITPIFLAGFVPLVFLYKKVQEYYRHTARELKRTESLARSPLITNFSETLSGVATIRAFQWTERFVAKNLALIDKLNRVYIPNNTANRWLGVRVEFCGNGIGTFAALSAVAFACLHWLEGREYLVGLALTLALSVTNTLGWTVRMSSEVEANLNSVERVIEYHHLASEAPAESTSGNEPPPDWPPRGTVELENVSLRYREGLDLVLRDVSVTFNGGEKIGVCGRTGAGKSSLIVALFRIAELAEGRIRIDGRDVSQMGLRDLRKAMTIVPQDPLLFTGSVRFNLDPFNEYSDDDIWGVVDEVNLRRVLERLEGGLNAPVSENGSNFSTGERQLFCMARALLRRTKIILMDEATASADVETDAIIQKAIRTSCARCTVITIAHRLNTIADYDRILVLDQGKVAEYASPAELLANPNSIFASMMHESKKKKKAQDA